ncbi:MAG TPA: dienelactone hydrolase family protein [Candidatus Omnitrophota bacterium]|nr:dienelactone hydrolase family protein [Candidatus Omnitrophota bacterium]
MKKIWMLLMFLFLFVSASKAELVKELVEYKDGDTALEGYVVYDNATEGKRPGVIVIHDWMGFGEYGNMRADMLAELGYVAFAADIYGKGVRPKDAAEAGAQAGKFKGDRTLLRQRVIAALNELKKHPMVDAAKTGAIGYCFGGTTVLELARSGADVTGVVSFHGGLGKGEVAGTDSINAKVLVLHGADDPHVPPEEIAAFMKEMNDAKADWQMVHYSGAVHSFTKEAAGNDKASGNAYDATADKRSWKAMKGFFKEIFGMEKK